jgi:hypothetical protein
MSKLHSDASQINSRNAIINGNFLFWNRATSFNPIVTGYTADRWRVGVSTDGSMRVDREITITPNDSIPRCLKATVVTGDSSLASTQYCSIFQRIEGYNYLPFIGKTATLSFWARSSLTGTYSVIFRNEGYDRSYVAEYTIDDVNTWEYKTITLKFDYSGGTWNTTNGVGLDVLFSLGCGSGYAASPGQWVSSNIVSSTNQVNWMATAGNTFYLSNVQLELGSSDSPFEYLPFATQYLKCLRYYEAKYLYVNATNTSTGGGNIYNMVTYFHKRASPTVTNAGDLTIWARVEWYDATVVSIATWSDRMYFHFDDTAHTNYLYGASLLRGTFYIDAEL